MPCWVRIACVSLLLLAAHMVRPVSEASAQDVKPLDWQVVKSSGDVWLSTSGVLPVSLSDKEPLKPGDSIRTGRNGRVLLVRGEETILIAPNSVVGLPENEKEGSATTILQQAGSILLDVEKRNVKNFEVETPYLVAAVKGTQFRVSVNRNDASVEVLRGEVEVSDFKSGQLALVLPGQTAKVSASGSGGLSLSGAGVLSPVRQGERRQSSLQPVAIPRRGLSAPGGVKDGQQVRALGKLGLASGASFLRIAVPLGDIKLDIQKVTKGLAHGTVNSPSTNGHAAQQTVWSSGSLTPGNGIGASYNLGNNGSGNGNGSANGNSGGNGNAGGNGNGNAYGAVNANAGGNGNAFGLGNNNGNGNGNGHGHGKP
jgi:FecR-like protein